MSDIPNSQVLERIFKESARDRSKFPRMPNDYYLQYSSFVNALRCDIYPMVDAGLSANSEMPGFYTAHNAEHFDEVVRYAGDLLGASDADIGAWGVLTPYELYILLVAIRIHDVGNLEGREQHEKKCFKFLCTYESLLGGDRSELKIISKIAEAHGGRINGSKDTIGLLQTSERVGSVYIRPRLLASILRFADEVCESRNRAANYSLRHGKLPRYSEIYHRYAAVISSSLYDFNERRLYLNFELKVDDITRRWGKSLRVDEMGEVLEEAYLIDEIFDRLDKMNRERKYCNMYSRGVYAVESIRATIRLVDDEHELIEEVPVPELTDVGYPEELDGQLKNSMGLREYCGESWAAKLLAKA
ncbi:hypothetical protein HU763_014870 [Pseudomonas anuradhapurensis]|uniref:HD domain-containing protein n=1 Tax=Pseudomonas anuradhapurensis TaxID=485870 RepID=UPI001644C1C0|nr:hypothetical protein [Pseudomonas anuradhapurensis]QXI46058.1 hypothetical protein HU763_014870 [Pseudomonas anuradhapurensis]